MIPIRDLRIRAILVSLVTHDIKRRSGDPEHSLQELISLAETAGVEVLSTLTQNKEAARFQMVYRQRESGGAERGGG